MIQFFLFFQLIYHLYIISITLRSISIISITKNITKHTPRIYCQFLVQLSYMPLRKFSNGIVLFLFSLTSFSSMELSDKREDSLLTKLWLMFVLNLESASEIGFDSVFLLLNFLVMLNSKSSLIKSSFCYPEPISKYLH